MFCIRCGKQLREGARFCEYCGAPVGEIDSAGRVEHAAPEQIAQIQAALKNKSSSRWLIGICVIAFIGVVMAVFLLKSHEAGSDAWNKEDGQWLLVSCKLTAYDPYQGEESIIDIPLWYELAYDEEGNKRKAVIYDSDGRVSEEYEYNAEGTMIKWSSYWIDAPAAASSKDDSYDTIWKEVCEYDAEGNQTRYAEYGLNGQILLERTYRNEYTYDALDRVVKAEFYHQSDRSLEWEEYEYDAEGRVLKKTFYLFEDNGIAYSWTDYIYDEEGGWSENEYLNPDFYGRNLDSARWDRKYDASGNEVGYLRYDISGTILEGYTCQCQYDEYGNIIEQQYIGVEGDREEYEYGLLEAMKIKVDYAEELFEIRNMQSTYGLFGFPTRMTYEYDETLYSNKSYWEYKYDARDRLVKATVTGYSSIGDFDEQDMLELEYDAEGKVARVVCRNVEGQTKYCQEYEYTFVKTPEKNSSVG